MQNIRFRPEGFAGLVAAGLLSSSRAAATVDHAKEPYEKA